MFPLHRDGHAYTSRTYPPTIPPNPPAPQIPPAPVVNYFQPARRKNHGDIRDCTPMLHPGSNEWVLCLDADNEEYFLNLRTGIKQTSSPQFVSQRTKKREVYILELKRDVIKYRRHIHALENAAYTTHLQAGGALDNKFEFTKGEQVEYIRGDTGDKGNNGNKGNNTTIQKAHVVEIHYDTPRFYTIQYISDIGETVEKNTTGENIFKM